METVAELSIGGLLRAAFLRGECVCASDFATAHGFTRQGVASVLGTMIKRDLLASTRETRTRSGVAIVWRCVDMVGMQAFKPKVQTQNPMLGRRRALGPFACLLEAWGIRHADLRLPGTRHLMAANDIEEVA